ncbi:hypothetical protein [Geobacillus vulcani]|uniref:hypothetical protein n=1 Tax=Geobacillus vulcani TaxID=135517 RepID=UPI0004DFA0E2|nr:hypothetical protein [Geobacillus vulcani]
MYAPFLNLRTQQEYFDYYVNNYCSNPIYTHDGLPVYFDRDRFSHAFFKSVDRRSADKSQFDIERAKRMNWIKKVLQDPSLQIYAGYDNKKKKTDHSRRVSIVVPERYAVIVRFNRKFDKCFFVTAFIVDTDDNLNKLIQEEIWRMPTHFVY